MLGITAGFIHRGTFEVICSVWRRFGVTLGAHSERFWRQKRYQGRQRLPFPKNFNSFGHDLEVAFGICLCFC